MEIRATIPYIAPQLVGIESVLTVMGIGSASGNVLVRDLPLIIVVLPAGEWPAPPWRSAPHWPCSCTRTRPQGCSPLAGAT